MDDLRNDHFLGWNCKIYVTVDYSVFPETLLQGIIGKKSQFYFEKVFQKYVSGFRQTSPTQISCCCKTGTTSPIKVGVF